MRERAASHPPQRSRREALALGLLSLAGAAVGGRMLGPTAAAASPGRALQNLKVRFVADLSEMDPALDFDPNVDYVLSNVNSRLLRYKPGTTELVGDLATRWEVSPDAKTFTFHLRTGVQWHKGFGSFTSADVKYSFERHLDPATKSLFGSYFRGLDRIETPDTATVRIVMKDPAPAFLGNALPWRPGYIVNRAALERYGKDYIHNAVGTGPYLFDHWTPGKEVVMVANDKFYGPPPAIPKVTFLPVPEDAVVELALQKRELEFAQILQTEVYRRLSRLPALRTSAKLGLQVYLVVLNTRRKPLDNVLVRRAIMHAIDRDAIVKTVFGGLGLKASGILNKNYYFHTYEVPQYDHDPARAKQLLTAAGVGGGFDTSILYFTEPPYPEIVPLIEANLAAVGIRLRPRPLEFAAFQQVRRAGDYDLLSAVPSRPPDPDTLFSEFFHSQSVPPRGSNNAYYSGADDLIDRARVSGDPARRKALYADVQRRIAEDVPVIPLLNPYLTWAMQQYLQGFTGVTFYDIPLASLRGG